MAILGNVDIEVSCDCCGKTANVDVSNVVHERLRTRGWHNIEGQGDDCCPDCVAANEEANDE